MHIKKINKKILALTIATSFTLLGCEKASNTQTNNTSVEPLQIMYAAGQSDIDQVANNLQVNYRVISNVPSNKCDAKVENGTCYEAELSFTAPSSINAKDWLIHFSHIAPIQSFESEEFAVEHLNGDLHRITLKEGFTGFKVDETKKILIRAQFWMLSESDAMPNYIVSAQGFQSRVIDSTRPTIDSETGLEILHHITPLTSISTRNKKDIYL